VATWIEQGSRGLAHAVMGDFPTFADALFEVVDNPLDYRRGRHLEIDITIQKDHDFIAVEDRGGEGMDDDGVADWLKWGTGHPHVDSDIGQYHKGGKAACGYLADSIVILTRRAGTKEVWRFEDLHWKSRTEWAIYPDPEPYSGPIPEHLAKLPIEQGFTRLELSGLEDRRYNVEKLRWLIGNTYRRLINDRHLTIRLNTKVVEAQKLPMSSAFAPRSDEVRLASGRKVRVWVGRLERDALKDGVNRVQGGVRLLYQGRLIAEGEYFGNNLGGQGQLASLIGEADLNHVPPLSNKTGFKQSTPEWEEVDAALHDWLAPIITEFRRAAEAQPVTREERKRAAQVQRQLTEAFRQLRTEPGSGPDRSEDESAQGGRRPPRRKRDHAAGPLLGGTNRSPTPKTEAPADAVGVLERLARRLKRGNEAPPIELTDLDPSVRSEALRRGDTVVKVLINRLFPVYAELRGHEAYLAETALIELLKPTVDERIPVGEFINDLNRALDAWWKVSQDAAHDEAA
jgi:hypothetical protein